MEEQVARKEIAFTYTYDQFTVFFHKDHVFVGEQDYPVGQCCVDIMNLDASVLDEIDRRVLAFIPCAEALLTEKTIQAARSAQEKLNAVWDVVFTLPVSALPRIAQGKIHKRKRISPAPFFGTQSDIQNLKFSRQYAQRDVSAQSAVTKKAVSGKPVLPPRIGKLFRRPERRKAARFQRSGLRHIIQCKSAYFFHTRPYSRHDVMK